MNYVIEDDPAENEDGKVLYNVVKEAEVLAKVNALFWLVKFVQSY